MPRFSVQTATPAPTVGDDTARLWDAATGQPTGKPMKYRGGAVMACSPDGRTIVTGSLDKAARLWDATTGSPVGKAMQHQDAVEAVAFSPDGKTIVTGSWDNTARLWMSPPVNP